MRNLKDLQEALNKVKDQDRLSQFVVTPRLWGFEDPEAKIGVHFYADEGSDDWHKNMKMYDDKSFEQISKFFEEVEQSVKTAIAAGLDDNLFEDLCYKER